jgi:hypothetical protein
MHLLKKLTFALIAFSLLVSSAQAQKKALSDIEVKKTSELNDATSQNLTYALPKTVVKIEIETEKIIKKAGPYYRYSQRFLNLNNVITEDSEEWIIKGIKVTTAGTPDEENRYSIFSTGNNSASMINLTPEGILAGINTTNIDQPAPPAKHKKESYIPTIEDIDFDQTPLHEDLLLKTSTAAMAQEAANMIYKIRNNRIDLLSGELENLPPDGKAYKTVLDELNKLEQDFITLFTGKTVTVSKKETIEITPDPLSSYNNYVLCRFSKQKGLIEAMDITGTPIYFKLDIISTPALTNKNTEPLKNSLKKGLFYCVPSSAKITIIDKNLQIASKNVDLAQYGQIISMPASILEKEGVTMQFCPATGALISIGNQ